jgi:hypothetical protein
MSALPPIADIHRRDCDVRFVPKADIVRRSAECRYSINSETQDACFVVRARSLHAKVKRMTTTRVSWP